MSKELQVFGFEGQDVRVVFREEEPWFVLKDVCAVLGILDSRQTEERLDADEKLMVSSTTSLGASIGQRGGWLVNEFGLYSILGRSDKPEAKKFQRWINHEVLPSIRKHGGYLLGQNEMSREEFLAKAVLMSDSLLKEKDAIIAKKDQELLEVAPMVEGFNGLMRSKETMSITECSKHFNLHPKSQVFPYLRAHGLLTQKDLPTQKAMDSGYMTVRQTPIPNTDRFMSQAVVCKRHLDNWRTKLVPKITKELEEV